MRLWTVLLLVAFAPTCVLAQGRCPVNGPCPTKQESWLVKKPAPNPAIDAAAKERRAKLLSQKIVMGVFMQAGCPPCKLAEEDLRNLERSGYPLARYNCDKNADLAESYKVRSTPTFVMMRGALEVARMEGFDAGDGPKLTEMFVLAVNQAASEAPADPEGMKAPRPDPPTTLPKQGLEPDEALPLPVPPPPVPEAKGAASAGKRAETKPPADETKGANRETGPPKPETPPPAAETRPQPTGPQTVVVEADARLMSVLQEIASNTRPSKVEPVDNTGSWWAELGWKLPSRTNMIACAFAALVAGCVVVLLAKRAFRAAGVAVCLAVVIWALGQDYMPQSLGGTITPYVVVVEETKSRAQWQRAVQQSQAVEDYIASRNGKYRVIDKDIKTVTPDGKEATPPELVPIIAAAEAAGDLPQAVICTPQKEIVAVKPLPHDAEKFVDLLKSYGG